VTWRERRTPSEPRLTPPSRSFSGRQQNERA
jgi:hypothetical protein